MSAGWAAWPWELPVSALVTKLHQISGENRFCPKVRSNSSSAAVLQWPGKEIFYSSEQGKDFRNARIVRETILSLPPHHVGQLGVQADTSSVGVSCTGVLGFCSVWVAAESTPRVRFSAMHPVCGITQQGAPSADHSQSFLNCKSSLSWVVGPCSHSTALWLLPRRPCLLSRGNTTPWESWPLFCHTVTWPLTAAVPGVAWHPSGYVFISKPFLNRENSAQDSRLLIIYALNGS